jgi:hypothetical protein
LNGKFDVGQQPFSGITEAFDGFCTQILQGDEDEQMLLTASIQRAISNRSQVLTHVILNLGSLLNHNNSVETTTTTITTTHTDKEWNRLTYVQDLWRQVWINRRFVLFSIQRNSPK